MTDIDRLASTIAAAIDGDAEAGRELLSMAAMQLNEQGTLEPTLAGYLAVTLERVYRGSSDEAAKNLNISAKKQPPHRLPDKAHKAAMHRALDIACEVQAISRGDLANTLSEASRISKITDPDERTAQLIDWTDEYLEAKSQPDTTKLFDLAARIFNRTLEAAQAKGQRISEKPATVPAMSSEYYRRKRVAEVC